MRLIHTNSNTRISSQIRHNITIAYKQKRLYQAMISSQIRHNITIAYKQKRLYQAMRYSRLSYIRLVIFFL